ARLRRAAGGRNGDRRAEARDRGPGRRGHSESARRADGGAAQSGRSALQTAERWRGVQRRPGWRLCGRRGAAGAGRRGRKNRRRHRCGGRRRQELIAERMDFYVILGLGRDATPGDIKRAYKRLARRFHPDINPGDRMAAAQFRQIAEAYETLSDPDRRRRYDAGGGSSAIEESTFGFEGFDFSV